MDNAGDSMNENVESSFHSNSTNMSSPQRGKRPKDPKTARVFVIDDSSSCDKLLQFHCSKYTFKMNYIGIDCEWVNKEGQVNIPVALLQIATPLCDCFLVRLCKMDGQMPQIVKEILEDKTVLKFGVGIQNDAKRLLEMFGIHFRGCVDLRHVAQRIQLENGDQSCQKMSLDALAKRILGVTLNKSSRIQHSNWEEEKLSTQQIEYAMNDALVGSHIFLRLVKERDKQSLDSEDFSSGKEMFGFRDGCNRDEGREEGGGYLDEHHDSPTSEFAENRNPTQEERYQEKSMIRADYYETTVDLSKFESDEMAGYFSRDEVISLFSDPYFSQRGSLLCQGVTDIDFKGRKEVFSKKNRTEKSNKSSKNGTRKSPLYMGNKLTAPDGRRLGGVNPKKADWYIDRGLGQKTEDDPCTVQLNFEPAGRPGTEDHYLNRCVVCGDDERYMRKSIVPHDYRRHFPPVLKDHNPHDILLTCPRCHSLANFFDDQLRKELAIKYNAPLGNATDSRVEDPRLKEVKKAAKALSHPGWRKMKADKPQELLIVQNYYDTSDLTPDMIVQAASMETHEENANFKSHGRTVFEQVYRQGKLLEFEKMWREHFVDKMQPKFLPPSWSVDRPLEGLKSKMKGCTDHL